MNTPIRILYINGGTMDMGGISSYMMNYYRHFNKDVVQIDFVVHGKGGAYDEEIRSYGGNVFHIPTKKENFLENIKQLKKIMKNGNYQIVHSHMDGMNGVALKLAKDSGIKVRISHSHNTSYLTNNKIKMAVHELIKKTIPRYATQLWACSDAAGKWLYGNKEFKVIPNAINITKFEFDIEARNAIRKKLQIEDKYVIGHIGKFEYQKNHDFLISIFADIAYQNPSATLVLVGDGSRRKNIEEKVRDLKLADRVIFLGQRTDVDKLFNIFDVFVLPSNFEGLPVVAVEAQANGLKCVCASTITEEINVTGNVTFIGLNDSVEKWESTICKRQQRDDAAPIKVANQGYSILIESRKLEKEYINLVRKAN